MALVLTLIGFLVIGAGLVWFLLSQDQGKKEPATALWTVFGLAILGVILAMILEAIVIPKKDLSLVVAQPLPKVFLATLGVGVIEESCKFFPTALYLRHRRFFRDHIDGVIFFALAGLCFGIPENILYTAQFGAQTGMVRLFLDPFFHASTMALVGFYYGLDRLADRRYWRTGLALVFAILLHAMFDFGLMSHQPLFGMGSFAISFGLAAYLFVVYAKAAALDREQGMAVNGPNRFCRNCGQRNPHQELFCTVCGVRA